jgi:hypothetical protein
MRSRLLVTAFALAFTSVVASCGDEITAINENFEDNATWEAVLNGANETPAVTTSGTGRALFIDRGNTIDFYIEYSGLTSNTTNAHIHRGATGVAGGTMVQLPFVTGATSGTVIGTIDMTRLSGGVNDVAPLETGNQSAADFRALLNSGGAYVNYHSVNNGGGEIRGQIVPR